MKSNYGLFMKTIIAYIRIVFFVLSMILVIPPLCILYKTRIAPYYNLIAFKIFCFCLGMKTKILKGKIVKDKKNLLVINHASYLDIFGIGSKIIANFVSKDDVKKWPVFGLAATIGNTIFISRNKMKAAHEVNFMEKELEKRKIPVIVFPEGTSTDGNEVLPFKSSLFAMFEDKFGKKTDNPILIQPVSIAYMYEGKKRLTPEQRHNYAWYVKEQTLGGHLLNAMKHTPFTLEIIVHDPVNLNDFKDRKELAKYCYEIVNKGFKEIISK